MQTEASIIIDRVEYNNKAEYEKKLIESVIVSIENHGGKNCLSSIIVTGSFGRGEPTYTDDEGGHLHLKSDVEIALIYPGSGKKEAVAKLIQHVSADFEEELNLMAIDEKRVRKTYNFNFSLVIPKYKTIFNYDLFNGSTTVWGRDFICEKHISLADCDIYEAKRLVANRIGELVFLQNTSDDSQKEYLRKQWKGKLVLAIVSAWLICEGNYVSSYHGQHAAIKKTQKKVEQEIGKDFFADYNKVFIFLRESGSEYEVTDYKLQEYVANIDRIFKKYCINRSRVNTVSRLAKYFAKYVKTGMKYGIIHFEDKILQALIDGFWMQKSVLSDTADVWHRVLY